MKKSTKKVVSMVLAASMMFTSTAVSPVFAASDVVAFATSSVTNHKTADGEVYTAELPKVVAGTDKSNSKVLTGSDGNIEAHSGNVTVTCKFTSDSTDGKGTLLTLQTIDAESGTLADSEYLAIRLTDTAGTSVASKSSDDAAAAGTFVAGENTITFTFNTEDHTGTVNFNGVETAITDADEIENICGVKFNKKTQRTITITDFSITSDGATETTTESTTAESTTETTTESTTEATTATESTTEATTAESTTEATTVTTTEETTTETTTELVKEANVAYIQPVADDAVAQNGKNVLDSATYMDKEVVVKLELSNVENTPGINNYTFFVTYNPKVVEMTGISPVSDKSTYATFRGMDDATGEIVDNLFYSASAITKSIALTPASTSADYADVAADGATTCGKLGKVKFANTVGLVSDPDNSKVLASVKKSGTLVALKFKVVGEGDSEIAVDVSAGGLVNGLKNSNDSSLTSQAIAGNIVVGTVETTTTTTETTTETTTVTTTEETSSEATTEETSTEVTTAESTETTTEETTESTTESTESTTEETTETTTKKSSSSRSGGGGSSSSKASTKNDDKKADYDSSKNTTSKDKDTTSSKNTVTAVPSFTITNAAGKEVTIAPHSVDTSISSKFTDTSSRPWAEASITKLVQAGIANGVSATSFAPDAYSKRADFVIMIVNTLGITGTASTNFTDVYAGKYYYNAVGLGYEAGIVSGYGDGTFGPERYCTREEMMVLVAQTFKFLGVDITTSESVLDKYADKATISDWAKPYVAFLTEAGIATGTGANLEPKVNITRAQMAVMIAKVYDYVVDMANEYAAEAAAAETTTEVVEDSTEETTAADEDAETTTVEADAETTTEAE